jgi:hypothetical protein
MVRKGVFRCHCSALLAVAALLAAESSAQQPSHPAKAPKKSSPPPVVDFQPGLEPKAIELLKAASARLAAARTMSFMAIVSYESPSRLGPPLVYSTKSEVTLQRPDKLRVLTSGDGPGRPPDSARSTTQDQSVTSRTPFSESTAGRNVSR